MPNKPRTSPPPADTPAQQAAVRTLLRLGAACGAAIAITGAWLLSLGVAHDVLLPVRIGIGFVLLALGIISCAAGLYAANHARLADGKLLLDDQARRLIAGPGFARGLKICGHATGITLLLVSWLGVYYPQGIPLP